MKTRFVLAFFILIFISACNSTFEVGIEHAPGEIPAVSANPNETQVPPPTSVPIPSATTDFQPTLTIPISTDEVSTDTQVMPPASTTQMVKIFMIAVDDNGHTGIPVGCGDSAVPVMVEIPSTQAVLKSALEALLSTKAQFYGQSGLYNALYQSDLQLESVNIDNSGKASVYLTGNLKMGGECDTPRVQAQLEHTVRQFPTVTEVDIFINGKPIADVLSLKG